MIARSLASTVLCTTSGAATIVHLTGSKTSGTTNGAQFVFSTQPPTGTGVIDPFLRLENTPTGQLQRNGFGGGRQSC